ncbi:MAG: site-specific integrase [Myxococcota bacterium]
MLLPPNGQHWWRARFTDPDRGQECRVTLDRGLRTQKQREEWAARWSRKLEQRRLELADGAPRFTGMLLKDAIAKYYDEHPQLRPRTVTTYQGATSAFLAFCEKQRIRTVDDLTRGVLMEFRAALLAEKRSEHTTNRKLRSLKTCLAYLVDADVFPRLRHDDLRRLKQVRAPVERPDFLKPAEIKRLLEAAERHDRAVFAETRDEHTGKRPKGSTPRHKPITAFVVMALLTGMRRGELLALRWSNVDLDARDENRKRVGEIYVTSASKTARARTVDLGVSPALRKLLAAHKLESGGRGKVFDLTAEETRCAADRLRLEYGAPPRFTWQACRRTTSTFLCNAPSIFGAASAYRSARQLGHSTAVSEKHYAGLLRGLDPAARTLEDAMGITKQLNKIRKAPARVQAQART